MKFNRELNYLVELTQNQIQKTQKVEKEKKYLESQLEVAIVNL